MKEIIVIAGTTASGKSSSALQLAKQINGFIINSDSRQVYKEIPICTAQPTPSEIKENNVWIVDGIEHYLYGFKELDEEYNVYQYQKDVHAILKQKDASNMTPILVGGTGLYIDSVVYNYKLDSIPENKYSREFLSSLSLSELQELAGDSIKTLNESDKNNPIRVIRLIEKDGSFTSKDQPLNHKYFILDLSQEELESNIKNRMEKMFREGLEGENKRVWEKYKRNLPKSLNTIGFSEFIPFFEGRLSLETTKELIFIHTRQYAKKQRTWFKRNKECYRIKNVNQILTILKGTSL